jgi:hypothetical protein
MTHIPDHDIVADSYEVDFSPNHYGSMSATIAKVKKAEAADALSVLFMRDDDEDGRSQFCWIRLVDGTLILGVFPQGETYYKFSGECP